MARDPKVLEEYRTQGELTYFAGKQEVAVNFIRQHPGTFVWLCVKRFYAFWVGLEEYGEISWTTLPIILFGMFGMVLLLRHRPRGTLLYFLPLLIYPLPYYLTHPDLRFRHLLEPLLILLGSYGVVQLTGRLQPAEDKVYVPAEDAAESDLDELPVLK
jgi:hypothetical protein